MLNKTIQNFGLVELISRWSGRWTGLFEDFVYQLRFPCNISILYRIIGHTDKIIGVDVSKTQVEVANKTLQHPSLSFVQVCMTIFDILYHTPSCSDADISHVH
jgi:hypothetical protein